ncbi:MAG: 16S rRNA processing protein RimM [Actinobacteria bacterium]|nr:16S rRNA processing protein RimM [Actinomycetota bacterium]
MTGAPAGYLEIGRLGRPHGLKGEVMVSLTTDRVAERLARGVTWWVGGREVGVESARAHQGRHAVKLTGVDDRDAAAALTGLFVFASPLGDADDDGIVWVHEVIGAEVVDVGGRSHGRVEAVQANPAHDLLVLEGGALVPMVFVVEQSEGRVVVDPPEGLLD